MAIDAIGQQKTKKPRFTGLYSVETLFSWTSLDVFIVILGGDRGIRTLDAVFDRMLP